MTPGAPDTASHHDHTDVVDEADRLQARVLERVCAARDHGPCSDAGSLAGSLVELRRLVGVLDPAAAAAPRRWRDRLGPGDRSTAYYRGYPPVQDELDAVLRRLQTVRAELTAPPARDEQAGIRADKDALWAVIGRLGADAAPSTDPAGLRLGRATRGYLALDATGAHDAELASAVDGVVSATVALLQTVVAAAQAAGVALALDGIGILGPRLPDGAADPGPGAVGLEEVRARHAAVTDALGDADAERQRALADLSAAIDALHDETARVAQVVG